MQERETDVLIVGAGPTGLTLAAALAQAGVRVILVDKAASRSENSKALGVQAGTLEALQDAFDHTLVDKMVGEGWKAQSGYFHFGGGAPVKFNLSLIPSRHNFILILSQSDTERLLEERLGPWSVKIERCVEVTHVEDQGQEVLTRLKNAEGVESTVRSQYTVGCDGAHSVVRHQLGFAFKGGAYSADFVLGDVKVTWEWGDGTARVFGSKKGTLICLPMKGERRYRLIGLQRNVQENAGKLELRELQAMASALSPTPVHLSEPVWLTRFRVHHRMTERFRKGRVFLAGDAAHIHSPAGGQGMNTGIQDAINLSSKLAAVLKRGAALSVLDDYEAERLPVARGVLRGTGLLTRFALLPGGVGSLLRAWVMPVVMGLPRTQRFLGTLLSQVKIARREIAARQALKSSLTP